MTQPIGELTDRMREIFGHVVEAYLERGLPIGSKALTGTVSLSPASIRGVMQELEERGLLTHPHTSAGRIPTPRGYRFFVDRGRHPAPRISLTCCATRSVAPPRARRAGATTERGDSPGPMAAAVTLIPDEARAVRGLRRIHRTHRGECAWTTVSGR